MNELNMSIYTGQQDQNKVMLTATFATHEAAVRFHEGLSALCKQHSIPIVGTSTWPKLLTRRP